MPPEFIAWRVAWSRWWRCRFRSMIDGGDLGRSRWWFNLSLWCGLVLVYVGLLGLCCGLIWVCEEAWRRGGMETIAFWSVALIFLCVGWSVLVDMMLNLIFRVGWSVCMGWSDFSLVSNDFSCGFISMCGLIEFFFGFWWFFVWVNRYVWVDLIFVWFLMMVVMVAVGLWERGAMREWIIKISKIRNILINKCVE